MHIPSVVFISFGFHSSSTIRKQQLVANHVKIQSASNESRDNLSSMYFFGDLLLIESAVITVTKSWLLSAMVHVNILLVYLSVLWWNSY